MEIQGLSGSVILILAFLIGISLGWILRGVKSEKRTSSADNEVRTSLLIPFRDFDTVARGNYLDLSTCKSS